MSSTGESIGIKFVEVDKEVSQEQKDADPNRPPRLEGFAACVTQDESRIFLFGGAEARGEERNNLFSYRLNKGWEKISYAEGSPVPDARVGAALEAAGTKLFLFGGCNSQKGWLNDLHEFDTETKSWRVVESKGDIPCPRDKTQLVFNPTDNLLYLFGGSAPSEPENSSENAAGNDKSAKSSNDVENSNDSDIQCVYSDVQEGAEVTFQCFKDFYSFDPATSTWKAMSVEEKGPPGLAAHSMSLVGNRLVIFGGKTQSGPRGNSVYVYDFGNKSWKSEVKNKVEEEIPCGRSYHATCALNPDLMLMIGGRDNDNFEMDDICLLYFGSDQEMQWLEPMVNDNAEESQPPSGRYGHVTGILKDEDSRRKVVIYGGLAELDPETMQADAVLSDMTYADVEDFVSFVDSVLEDEGGSDENGEGDEEVDEDDEVDEEEENEEDEAEDAAPAVKKAKMSSSEPESAVVETNGSGKNGNSEVANGN